MWVLILLTFRLLPLVEGDDVVGVGDLVLEALGEALGILDVEVAAVRGGEVDLEADEGQGPVGLVEEVAVAVSVLLLRLVPLGVGLLDHLLDDAHELPDDLDPVLLLPLQVLELVVLVEDELAVDEGPHGAQPVLLDLEVPARDADHGDVLILGLGPDQGRGDRGAGLHDVEAGGGVGLRVDLALVLVAPDDEVHPVGQHLGRQVVGLVVRGVVLVDGEQVEPVLGLDVGPEPLDAVVPQGAEEALVTDVAQAVEGQLGLALLQQDGADLDVVDLGDAAEVVDEAGDLEQLEGAEVAGAARLVVVPVDGEDGDGDVDVLVLVVDVAERAAEDLVGVAQKLQLARLHAEAVPPQRAHHLEHGLPGRVVVVEEVASQQNHVYLVRCVSEVSK